MPTRKKEEVTVKLEELLSTCTIAIVTNYQGLSVVEINQLRRKLRQSAIKYCVVKNTLAHLAAARAGKEGLKEFLQGPSAIVFGYGEVTEPARVLADYIQTSKATLNIKGGIMDGRILTPEDVMFLSSLPPKEVLISKVIQGIQMPLLSLVSLLSANLRRLIGALEARRQQLGGE
jgi:large subunit ribosomal protein L10